jgi:hypothetical protein
VTDYQRLFESAGFEVRYCQLRILQAVYPLPKIYDIFSSGAAAGYLNQDYYDIPIDEQYQRDVSAIFKRSIQEQARGQDRLTLSFKRVYILALK